MMMWNIFGASVVFETHFRNIIQSVMVKSRIDICNQLLKNLSLNLIFYSIFSHLFSKIINKFTFIHSFINNKWCLSYDRDSVNEVLVLYRKVKRDYIQSKYTVLFIRCCFSFENIIFHFVVIVVRVSLFAWFLQWFV